MKSVNKVILLGNLTRDPELRYTEYQKAVCTFGLATNRSWTTETGKKREEPEYHRLVAWETLAEFCSKYLRKGRKVYVEGRLHTRSYTAKDGTEKAATEVVVDDLVLLDAMPDTVREALEFQKPQ
jgi:single-strand DNA-binding protein